MRKGRAWRWMAACACGGFVLQSGGCAVDTTGLITQIVNLVLSTLLQSLLGSLTV